MPLRFFNTYSRQLEEFQPLDPAGRVVKIYTCGPTVYSHAHIGNFRAYLFEDLLQRHLELRRFTRWPNLRNHSRMPSSPISTLYESNARILIPRRQSNVISMP
jgi:hypothetical protein